MNAVLRGRGADDGTVAEPARPYHQVRARLAVLRDLASEVGKVAVSEKVEGLFRRPCAVGIVEGNGEPVRRNGHPPESIVERAGVLIIMQANLEGIAGFFYRAEVQ